MEKVFRSETNVPLDPEVFYFYQSIYLGIWASDFKKVSETKRTIPQTAYFFPDVMANCSSGEKISIEKLTNLKIINRKDIQITEGMFLKDADDITDKFLATSNFQQMETIENFLKREHRFQEQVRIHLRFNQKPISALELIFDVIVALDNGNSYIFRDQRFKISP